MLYKNTKKNINGKCNDVVYFEEKYGEMYSNPLFFMGTFKLLWEFLFFLREAFMGVHHILKYQVPKPMCLMRLSLHAKVVRNTMKIIKG